MEYRLQSVSQKWWITYTSEMKISQPSFYLGDNDLIEMLAGVAMQIDKHPVKDFTFSFSCGIILCDLEFM